MIYLITDIPKITGVRSIGAYRLATELRWAGYAVEVIDFLSWWNIDDLLAYIDSGPTPLWIGFSTTFMGQGKDGKIINEQHPWDFLTRFEENDQYFWSEIKKRAPVIIGGSKVTRLKYFYDADWVISGYADNAIVPISDYISGKSDELKFDTEKIQHIITNKEYEIKVINCEKDYPVTDISKIETLFHESDFIELGEALPLEISRGCIFKCAFCAFPLNGKNKNDYIRPRISILKDISRYQTKYKTNRYLFMDDTFNDTVEKMKMIKEVYDSVYPFEFWSYGRLDLIAAKPEMLELINQIGWKYMTFGVETFNRDAGKKIGKGADPEKLKKILTEIRKLHPTSWFIFEMIVGLPGETEASINETVDWFLNNIDLWDEIHFKELSVNNKNYDTWVSQMALEPEKFGIKIVSFNPKNYGLKWEHDTMNTDKASDLSHHAYRRISMVKKRTQHNYFFEVENISQDLLNLYKGDKILAYRQSIESRFKRYIQKKLSSRNL